MGRRFGSRAFTVWVGRQPWWKWAAAAAFGFGGMRLLTGMAEPGSAWRALGVVGQLAVPLACLMGMALSAWRLAWRRRQLAEFRATQWHSAISSLGSLEFRQLVSEALQREGAVLMDVTLEDAARGIDLMFRQGRQVTLVRCRHWPDAKAGVDHLQLIERACRSHRGAHAVVATSGEFTFTARAYARDRQIRLIDGPGLRELLADLPLAAFGRASQITGTTSRAPELPDDPPGFERPSVAPTAPLSVPLALGANPRA